MRVSWTTCPVTEAMERRETNACRDRRAAAVARSGQGVRQSAVRLHRTCPPRSAWRLRSSARPRAVQPQAEEAGAAGKAVAGEHGASRGEQGPTIADASGPASAARVIV